MTLQARYTILRKIADGGTAEIFLATQHGAHGFEKTVVLKRIFPAFYADPQFRNMLVDEAHIAMSLNHSNIVQVLDLGEAEGQYVLALELVDGWTLDAVLRRARALKTSIPPALALYMAAEVCRALAYAHAKVDADGKPLGIVHRDISPHNLLLSEQGEVKLTDFGIAKAHNRRESSVGHVIKGKIAYMSPEQASGTPLDARSDLFSVGTMLYMMVCHRYPFDAPTDLELLLVVKNGAYEPPEKALPGLNPEIYRVIKRALERSPAERYQRADEMLIDVEQVMRVAFHAVGQTELKRWLRDLSMRDGVPPLTRTPVSPLATGTTPEPAEIEVLELDDAGATSAPADLPPPIAGMRPGEPTPSGGLRAAATGRPRPPPPAAAMTAGPAKKKPNPAPTTEIPDAVPVAVSGSTSAGVRANASAKAASAPHAPPAVTRKSSSWVAQAVRESAKRAGTLPVPPAGKAVPPPPVHLDVPTEPNGGAAVRATPIDGPPPPRKRAWVVATGIGLVAVLVVGFSVRTCGGTAQVSEEASLHRSIRAEAGSASAAAAAAAHPAPTVPSTPPPILPGVDATAAVVEKTVDAAPVAAAMATATSDAATSDRGSATTLAPGIPAVDARNELAPEPVAVAATEGATAGGAGDSDSSEPDAAAVAVADKVVVLLSSTPPGAQVGTTRRSFGSTPVSVKLKVGRTYALTFAREGYRSITKQLRVTDAADQQISALLRREAPAQKTQLAPTVLPPAPRPKTEKSWFQRMFAR